MTVRSLILIAALLTIQSHQAIAQSPAKAQFIPLGDLPGGDWLSMPHDISADGSVVVGQSRGDLGPVAFRWVNGVMEPLHGLPADASISMAHAVSADGSVVAGSITLGNRTHAFRYQVGVRPEADPGAGADPGGKPEEPGGAFTILSRGASFSEAWDISMDGSIIVGQAMLGTQREAFIWRDGIMRFVPQIAEGSPAINAMGISADGSVVTGNAEANVGTRGFRWEEGSTTLLATRIDASGPSEARAISADGQVIVGSAQSRWGHEAARWVEADGPPQGPPFAIHRKSGPHALGGLSDHHELYSYANDVSVDGSVIVGSSENELGRHEAFVWTAIDGMRPLAELLVHEFQVDLQGWSLSEATAVSDDGCSLVGFGRNPENKFEGWLVRFDRAHWPSAQDDAQAARGTRFGWFRSAVIGLSEPTAAAIDKDGTICVAESGAARVTLYRSDGTGLRVIELPESCAPRDLAIGVEGFHVLDPMDRSVVIVSREGALVRRIELPRTGEYSITEAAALALHRDRILVVDRAGDRVIELDAAGKPVKALGATGDGAGKFRLPSDIAIADDGSIFIADTGNHRIQKFDAQGKHQLSFGQRGNVLGFFLNPASIALHGDHVFVADTANHRVQVFDRNTGRFAYAFGRRAMRPHVAEGALHYPDAIAISPDGGFAVIGESFENRIQLFDQLDRSRVRLAYTAASPTPPRPNYGPHVDVADDVLAVTQTDADTVELILLSSIPAQTAAIIGGYGTRPGQFIQPAGVRFDATNRRLLVTDRGTRRLQVFQLPQQLAVTVPLDPTTVRFVRSVDCQMWRKFIAPDAGAVIPDALEIDADGTMYVLDRGNRVVVALNDQLIPTRVIGAGELCEPTDIALNHTGELLLVCDRRADSVLGFDVSGGEKRFSLGGDHKTFNRPWGVHWDDNGFFYVSDDSNRIHKFDAARNLVLQWGEEGLRADQVFKPRGIAAGSANRLALLDWGNHRALICSPTGAMLDAVGWPLFVRPAKLELD